MKTEFITTPEMARRWLQSHPALDIVAFDTETTGLQVRSGYHDRVRLAQFSWRPWSEAIAVGMGEPWQRAFVVEVFKRSAEVIGHNLKFDIHAIATGGIDLLDYYDDRQLHDTRWQAHFYDERVSGKLKDLGVRYLGTDAADEQAALKKRMRTEKLTWATVPLEYLIEYGGQDTILTGRLFDYFAPLVSWAAEPYEREQRLLPVLVRAERAGLYVDQKHIRRVEQESEIARDQALARARALTNGELNLNSPMQLKAAFRERGTPLEDTTADTLLMLAYKTGDELATAIVDFRKHAKTLSTYIYPWQELITPESRLHPWLNQLGTKTGRFSSSDPNLQNITRGHALRDAFMASPGNRLIVADWNQVELRLYAHFARDENMRAAFLSGDDIYEQAADLLGGIPRQVGKMIMLASIYGAGYRKLKSQCIAMSLKFGQEELIPLLEGLDWEALYRRFHSIYRIQSLQKSTEQVAMARGNFGEAYIVTWGGRKMRPKQVRAKMRNGHRPMIPIFKDLANSLVQGSSADLMKQAMVDLAARGYGDAIRLTVHDEVILEVPEEDAETSAREVVSIMTRNEFVPPLTVNASTALRYGDAK